MSHVSGRVIGGNDTLNAAQPALVVWRCWRPTPRSATAPSTCSPRASARPAPRRPRCRIERRRWLVAEQDGYRRRLRLHPAGLTGASCSPEDDRARGQPAAAWLRLQPGTASRSPPAQWPASCWSTPRSMRLDGIVLRPAAPTTASATPTPRTPSRSRCGRSRRVKERPERQAWTADHRRPDAQGSARYAWPAHAQPDRPDHWSTPNAHATAAGAASAAAARRCLCRRQPVHKEVWPHHARRRGAQRRLRR